MIYLEIDISKLNHFSSALSSDGEILIEPFKFSNDSDGFHLLLSKIESFDKSSLIIGLESTAHYGSNIIRYLVSENYKVCVLDPIQTSAMSKTIFARRRLIKSTITLFTKLLGSSS